MPGCLLRRELIQIASHFYSCWMKSLKLCVLPQVNVNEEGTLPTREVKSGSTFCGGRWGKQHTRRGKSYWRQFRITVLLSRRALTSSRAFILKLISPMINLDLVSSENTEKVLENKSTPFSQGQIGFQKAARHGPLFTAVSWPTLRIEWKPFPMKGSSLNPSHTHYPLPSESGLPKYPWCYANIFFYDR